MLNPNAPKEGVVKKDYYLNRFGPRSIQMESRMTEVDFLILDVISPNQIVCFGCG